MKPPANMSPAPLVSIILSSASLGTGKLVGLGSPGRMLVTEVVGLEDATRVESAPWVTITRRGREALDLVELARVMAACSRDASYGCKYRIVIE
jgi:hypothetical protein